MRRYSIILIVAISTGSAAFGQTGGISGTIASASGFPIAGATVTYRRLVNFLANVGKGPPRLAPGEVHYGASAVTDAKGSHAAQGLPQGTYQVCVDVSGQPFLDPCKWSTPPSVQVKSGQTSVLTLSLRQGVFLQIRLNDPRSLLPTSVSPADSPHIITGVIFGTGAFLAAQRASVDSGGQNYRMPIPSGTPLNLWLFSGHVSLADSQGKTVPATGSKMAFQAVAGADQVFTVNITGPAAQR